MLKVDDYLDGIDFIKNGVEICFYSYITKKIYVSKQAYRAYEDESFSFDYTNLPLEEMKFIIETIEVRENGN